MGAWSALSEGSSGSDAIVFMRDFKGGERLVTKAFATSSRTWQKQLRKVNNITIKEDIHRHTHCDRRSFASKLIPSSRRRLDSARIALSFMVTLSEEIFMSLSSMPYLVFTTS